MFKRSTDWPFPLSEELGAMIDRLVDIVEAEGGKPPAPGSEGARWEYLHLLRDIQVESRQSLFRSEQQQGLIIRYYSFGDMFRC